MRRRSLATRNQRSATGAFFASGWVFAELAMVLMIVMLGSTAGLSWADRCKLGACPGDSPSANASANPTPTAKPKSKKNTRYGVSQVPHDFVVHMGGMGNRAAADQFVRELKATGREPGIILLYGKSWTSDPYVGVRVAENLRDLIRPYTHDPNRKNEIFVGAFMTGSSKLAPYDVNATVFFMKDTS